VAFYFFEGDDSVQEQSAESIAGALPSQTIAARTGGSAVLCRLGSALGSLEYVICFPMSIGLFNPTAIFKLDLVAAKMTVAFRLVENSSELST
jgi:hypothetical protein